MKTRLFTILLALLPLVTWGQGITAGDEAEAYAVLSDNNTVVTFYYDGEKAARGGININNDYINTYDRQASPYGTATTAVIDASFADYRPTSTRCWFQECAQLTAITGIENINTEAVTDMWNMFGGCGRLTSLDLSGFNTANVTNMQTMFSDCSSLTSLNVSRFNTQNVTDMRSMFYGCSSLTTLDVSGFNTQNVTDMGNMFSACSRLTTLDLSGFSTENVESMGYMFEYCSGLTSLDISGFNTVKVTEMSRMFRGCSSLTTIYAGSSWTTSAATDGGSNMFLGCTALVGGAGTAFDANNVGLTYARIDGGTDNPGYFTDKNASANAEAYAVLSDDGLTVTFYYDDQKAARGGMDINNRSLGIGVDSPYGSATLAVIDASFANYKPTSTICWFENCTQLTTIAGIENINTGDVTDMWYMFGGCSNLTSLDLSGFNTTNVTTLRDMFNNCSSLTNLDVSGFNTANVTTLRYMFNNCSSLTSLDVSGFNTEKVMDMTGMFSGCSSLTTLDVSGFKTDSVTLMNSMFSGCSSLTNLDVSGFNTEKVMNMRSMFYDCSGLTTLDVSGFKTDNVTDMRYTFCLCSGLTTLDVSGFKTDNVTYMRSMFSGCSGLTTLDVSGFNTANVTDMVAMFNDCSGLTTIYAGDGWSTSGVTQGSSVFSGCTALVGGLGTTYDEDHADYTYARIDGGTSAPGYFTDKNAAPAVTVSAPVFSFEGDNLVMTTETENASIFYKMEDVTDMDDTAVEQQLNNLTVTADGQQSAYYQQPVEVARNVVVKAIAVVDTQTGIVASDTTSLFYYYDVWSELLRTIDFGYSIYSLADGNAKVDTDLVEELKWAIDESKNFYTYRAEMPYQEAIHFIERIRDICGRIEDQMNAATTPEPYAVLSEDNSVLTFYYDDQRESRGGMEVGPFNHAGERGWADNASSITRVSFDTSFANAAVTSTAHWFYEMTNLTDIEGIQYLNTSNVTDMSEMFRTCTSLMNLDVSGFDTQNVTDMRSMFNSCHNLTSLDLSKFNTQNVTNMSGMLNYCYGLTSLNLSSFDTQHVTDMSWMFFNDINLKSIDLSSFNTQNVADMGAMFSYCSSLTTIYAGSNWTTNSVTNSLDMFSECSALVGGARTKYDANHTDYTYARIDGGTSAPGYFTDIKDKPSDEPIDFKDAEVKRRCIEHWDTNGDGELSYAEAAAVTELRNVFTMANNSEYITENDGTLTGGPAITTFDELQYFTGLTEIGRNAFYLCDSLVSITLPESIEGIGEYGLAKSPKLQTVNIPQSVRYIGESAFELCSSLDNITLPDGLESLGNGAFWNTGITSIVIPEGITELGHRVLSGCEKLTSVTLPSRLQVLGETAMEGCTAIEQLTLPESLVELGPNCLSGCTSLKAIEIPANVRSIGEGALKNCTSLTSIAFPEGLETIERNTLLSCENLTELHLPSTLTTIGPNAFSRCLALEDVTIPQNVTTIEEAAFSECSALKTIATKIISPMEIPDNTFEAMTYETATLVVPDESEQAYRNTAAWNRFYRIRTVNGSILDPYIALSNDSTTLTFYYDENMSRLNGMPVEDTSTWQFDRSAIAEVVFDSSFAGYYPTTTAYWFDGYSSLDHITGIEYLKTDSVENMWGMFRGCSSLKSLDLSGFHTEKVGDMDSMFSGCSSLTSLDLSGFNTARVGSMGYMFNDCSALTSLDISNFDTGHVGWMGWMFQGCSSLTSLDLSSFNTSGCNDMGLMFSRCSELKTIYVGEGWTDNGNEGTLMFELCTNLVGGAGTHYDAEHIDATYARIDYRDTPGYLTPKNGYAPMPTYSIDKNVLTIDVPEDAQVYYYMNDLYMGEISEGVPFEHGDSLRMPNTLYTEPIVMTTSSRVRFMAVKEPMAHSEIVVVKYIYKQKLDYDYDPVTGVLRIGGETALADALEDAGGRNEVAKTISSILWQNRGNLSDSDLEGISNPNLLVYVNTVEQAPSSVQNVVVDGVAEQIVLTDAASGNNNFYVPQAFRAEHISYSRTFSQATEVGVSRGWESIALPFAVQRITHETRGSIAPFASATESQKPFWLRTLSRTGLESAGSIEAYTPYIIAMPNNATYPEEYNLAGRVTFESTGIEVLPTPESESMSLSYGSVTMVPCFTAVAQAEGTYALNVGQAQGGNPEGSVYANGLREVRPFEVYTRHEASGVRPMYVPLSTLMQTVTGIEDIETIGSSSESAEGAGPWFTLDGRKINGQPKAKGVFVRKGQKRIM